jgi:phosphopantothenoylcysteine decarboxylase/phosphopantothenate--cysteine ligase
VVLVSGPTDLKIPDGVDWVPVRATEEMRRAVLDRARDANIVIMAAAVADYRAATSHDKKMKREGSITLDLEPTPDILAELGRSPHDAQQHHRRVLVGFAAETDRVAENARGKLERKGADMIVANDVTQEGAGFDTDTNIVTIYVRDGREIALPKMSKFDVANRILDQILHLQKSQ